MAFPLGPLALGQGLRPAGAGLFLGAEQDQGRQALVLAACQQLREPGKGSHCGDVVEDERHWWVEPTVG